MSNADEKSFLKWISKKWFFWVIVIIHSILVPRLSSGLGGSLFSVMSAIAVWSLVFWIISNIIEKKKKIE